MEKIPVWLSLPGAGTALGVLSAAVKTLSRRYRFLGYGGTSGGGLIALYLASGKTPEQACELASKILVRKDLLDLGWPFDTNPGLYRGARIEKLLKEEFGDLRMGQLQYPARVTAANLWISRSCVFDSTAHPDVLVWRAARATMAIELFFDPCQVRPDDNRTYGDGGLGLNVPAGIWDDQPEPTLVMRFAGQQREHTVTDLIRLADAGSEPSLVRPVRSYKELVPAIFRLAMAGCSASWPTDKKNAVELVVPDFDGLKFGLSPAEGEERHVAGVTAALNFLSAQRT